MAYKLIYSAKALKVLSKVPTATAKAIHEKMSQIAQNPFTQVDIKKLRGREGFRLRIGEWRVIFEIHKDEIVVLVVKIGLRKDVYK